MTALTTMFFKLLKKFEYRNAKYMHKPFSSKIENRVAKIPSSELEMWADQSLFELGRCLSQYLKTREEVYLDEARVGVEALHAVVEEIYKRRNIL